MLQETYLYNLVLDGKYLLASTVTDLCGVVIVAVVDLTFYTVMVDVSGILAMAGRRMHAF